MGHLPIAFPELLAGSLVGNRTAGMQTGPIWGINITGRRSITLYATVMALKEIFF